MEEATTDWCVEAQAKAAAPSGKNGGAEASYCESTSEGSSTEASETNDVSSAITQGREDVANNVNANQGSTTKDETTTTETSSSKTITITAG